MKSSSHRSMDESKWNVRVMEGRVEERWMDRKEPTTKERFVDATRSLVGSGRLSERGKEPLYWRRLGERCRYPRSGLRSGQEGPGMICDCVVNRARYRVGSWEKETQETVHGSKPDVEVSGVVLVSK